MSDPSGACHDRLLCLPVHAFGSAIPGWLVVVCRRHITSMSQLTPQEATVVGPLLSTLSAALEDVLEARKAYMAFLAEAKSLEHLHVHVMLRKDDMPPEQRGKRVFDWLDMPKEEAITDEEADRIALDLRPLVAREMSY
jgi:diadenosine tetraphosphate (Ap4A) HIT family hydrolase